AAAPWGGEALPQHAHRTRAFSGGPSNRALELSGRAGLASHPRAAARTLRERAPRRAQFACGAAAGVVEGRTASARPALQLSARSLDGPEKHASASLRPAVARCPCDEATQRLRLGLLRTPDRLAKAWYIAGD